MSISPSNTIFKTANGTCQRLAIGGANFSVWQRQAQVLLNGENLLDIVLGNELCPSIPIGAAITANIGVDGAAIAASTALVNPATVNSAVLAVEKWRLKSQKAGCMLYSTLSEPVQASVHQHWQDPMKLWTALKSQYDITEIPGIALHIARQFYADKLGENEHIEQYIARIVNYRNQLAFTRFPLSENTVVARFLAALTPAWVTYVDAINLADEDFNFEKVCSTLRSHSTYTHKPETTASSRRGVRSRRRGRGRGSSRRRGASSSAAQPSNITKDYAIKCCLCGETGHKLLDCPVRKRYAEYKLATGPKGEGSGSGSHGTAA